LLVSGLVSGFVPGFVIAGWQHRPSKKAGIMADYIAGPGKLVQG